MTATAGKPTGLRAAGKAAGDTAAGDTAARDRDAAGKAAGDTAARDKAARDRDAAGKATGDTAAGDKAASGIARRRAAARDEANPSYLQRRREIVQAAAGVFKAKGLQGANLGDIAAASGADRASLYYYVGNKEELFHEVVREAAEANLARARQIQSSPGTAPEKLRELVESLMVSYAEHYPILYVYIQENLSQVADKHAAWANDMRRVNREYEKIMIDVVQEGMDEGSVRPIAPAWIVAYGLMGMLGWTNRWFNPGESAATAEQIGAAFADTVLLGLQQPKGRRRSP